MSSYLECVLPMGSLYAFRLVGGAEACAQGVTPTSPASCLEVDQESSTVLRKEMEAMFE